MVPGLTPMPMGSILGGRPSTISFVGGLGVNGPTILVPADIRKGDLAVHFDWCFRNGSSSLAAVVPTGFTALANHSDSSGSGSSASISRAITSFKILVAADAGSTLAGMNTTADRKCLMIFRGNKPIREVTFATWNGSVDYVSARGAQTVAASAATKPLVVIGCSGAPPSNANFTGSGTFDGQVANGDSSCRMGYKLFNGATSNFIVDHSGSAAGYYGLQSGYLRIA